MTTLKCRCGFDSGFPSLKGAYNIGEVTSKSGMNFIGLADGGCTWICQKCSARVAEAAALITKLVGSDLWVADSFFGLTLDKKES